MGLERLHAFEVINENVNSTVHRAVQVLDGGVERPVAVKVLHGVSPERAMRELNLTVVLGEHPKIVTVHDIARDDGKPCIIMEYCPHGSLAPRCGRMPVAEVIAAGIAVADALAFAHARDVLHRDVKPDNILIRGDAPELPSSYVLADFGIARFTGKVTAHGGNECTYFYASPQRFRGESPTAADDVWALGATLFTLLDGAPPFAVVNTDDNSPNDVAAYTLRLISQLPGDLRLSGVPAELRQAIRRCLDPDPAGRYGTASEPRDALAAIRLPQLNTGEVPAPSALADRAPAARTDDVPAVSELPPPATGSKRRRVLVIAAVACAVLTALGALAWAGLRSDPAAGPAATTDQSPRSATDTIALTASSAPPSTQPTPAPTPTPQPANSPAVQQPANPGAVPLAVTLPAKACGTIARKNYWAVEVCSHHLETDGLKVYGYLFIKCLTGTYPQIDCQEIRIKEVELFDGYRCLTG